MNHNQTIIGPSTSIIDAIKEMNKVYEKGGEPGVAVILNHNNHVLGVITDGDIRRSLLKNIEMVCYARCKGSGILMGNC